MTSRLSAWIEAVTGQGAGPLTRLAGATSADVYGVRVGDRDLVAKHFTTARFVTEAPDRALHESEMLDHVASHSTVPVPAVVAVDVDGTETGAPAVLMTRLEGTGEVPRPGHDVLVRLASWAREIHTITTQGVRWQHERYTRPGSGFVPSWASDTGVWRSAITLTDNESAYESVFIHRDYHPANLLWRGDEASGVVDWLYACLGPAGEDFGRVVVNLAVLFGLEAAADFMTVIGSDHDPFWTVACCLDWLPFHEDADAVEGWGTGEQRTQIEGVLRLAMGNAGA